MFIYKNLSSTTKTFYGVVFPPGQSRTVPGPINHKSLMKMPMPKVNPKQDPATSNIADKTADKPSKPKPGPKPKIRKDEEPAKTDNKSAKEDEVIKPDVSDEQEEKEEGGKE